MSDMKEVLYLTPSEACLVHDALVLVQSKGGITALPDLKAYVSVMEKLGKLKTVADALKRAAKAPEVKG